MNFICWSLQVLQIRSYNQKHIMINSDQKVSARLDLRPDGKGRMTSIYGELDMDIPPTPQLVAEKIALLKLCALGTRVQGVGKKQREGIYYLWFTRNEVKEVLNQRSQIQTESENAIRK